MDKITSLCTYSLEICKSILKKVALPYLDHDMVYRQKQGFGAPMEEWFKEGDYG
ncbi:MAG: hypothetical protein F6J92_34825 [Symploca sp. SIO1A3]|nr:hypothetical protein [Symploca sp. SIO1A3]